MPSEALSRVPGESARLGARWVKRVAGVIAVVVSAVLTGAMLLWALAAAWFGPVHRLASLPVVAAAVAGVAWCWGRRRPRSHAAVLGLGIATALVALWTLGLQPSNTREWQADVARTPYATFSASHVTVHNVRNCSYRSAAEFDVHYEDRTYDLNALRYADLYLVDWGLGAIAHTMFSFVFEDGRALCFSIETRKETGEEYSAIRGFFRNYELIYVAADEGDVVRLRTNLREGESVRLYRMHPKKPGIIRDVFLEYLNRINQLHEQPEWYNALTDNCMTSAYKNIAKHSVQRNWDLRIFLNGYADELAYESGAIYTGMPFPELRQACLINERAKSVQPGADFSKVIRENLPGLAPPDSKASPDCLGSP